MKKIMFVFTLMSSIFLTGCMSDMDVSPESYKNYQATSESYQESDFYMDTNTEDYASLPENPFISVNDMAVSTFSADVDTASYSNVRRMLNDSYLPHTDAVRIEELINYFDYDLSEPTGDEVISITTEVGVAPWNIEHQLLMYLKYQYPCQNVLF